MCWESTRSGEGGDGIEVREGEETEFTRLDWELEGKGTGLAGALVQVG